MDRKKVSTFAPAKLKGDALVAQLVEHLTLNQGVQGSSPCRRTNHDVMAASDGDVSHLFVF